MHRRDFSDDVKSRAVCGKSVRRQRHPAIRLQQAKLPVRHIPCRIADEDAHFVSKATVISPASPWRAALIRRLLKARFISPRSPVILT